MPSYALEESVTIAAPLGVVRPLLVDFAAWPSWSPWLYMEPEATITTRGTPGEVGHGYSWAGEFVGSGEMEILQVSEGHLEMRLTFLTPFKSTAEVAFDLSAEGESTRVTWKMSGNLPFFLFWMKNAMVGQIKHDYARGLTLLKNLAEHGDTRSHTEVVGAVEVPEALLLAHEASGPISDIPSVFHDAMAPLIDYQSIAIGPPHSVVLKFSPRRNQCALLAGFPVDAATPPPPAPLKLYKIPSSNGFKVVHTGPYEGLKNAWATAKARGGKGWRKAPFEVYLNDPKQTPEDELVTEITLR